MNRSIASAVVIAALGLGLQGCSTAPSSEAGKQTLDSDVNTALADFRRADPSIQGFLDKSYGYAVFPSVGKGAVGVGGAYGRGEVFEQGRKVGYADLSQATVGLQLGGQEYRELIVFQDKGALDRFRSGEYAFAAQASAVALKAGASTNADYKDGVAVFTTGEAGLMYEASIGGQKFSYQPLQ